MGMGLRPPKLDESGLTSILNVLCKELEENGLLPGMTKDQDAKEKFIAGVVDKIKEASDNDLASIDIDFRDDKEGVNNLMNTLKIITVAEFIKNEEVNPKPNPEFKLDPKKLIEDKSELKPEDLAKELKEEISKNLTAANKPQPKLSGKEIDKISDVLSKDLANDFKKKGQSRLANNKSSVDVAAELTVASLFGGKGPTESVLGNLAGLIDFNPGGGDALNFMAKQNTAEPGKADYTGAEKNVLVNAISKGGMSDDLENTLNSIIHPSPQNRATTPQ